MPTIVPLTTEITWLEWLAAQPTLAAWQVPLVPTLVIAPHPDDETLGAGGLIARLRAHGVTVTVAALTDGENAYADVASEDLARVRVAEQTEALTRLDVEPKHIKRLCLPDRHISVHLDHLVAQLTDIATPGVHVVAPWPRDFHPDHEAAGLAAEQVAQRLGLELTFYLFWTWHRGAPDVLSKVSLARLDLTKDEQVRRELALQAHASQFEHADGQPILSDELLQPARRTFEVYIRP